MLEHPDYTADMVVQNITFISSRATGSAAPMKNKPSLPSLRRLVRQEFLSQSRIQKPEIPVRT